MMLCRFSGAARKWLFFSTITASLLATSAQTSCDFASFYANVDLYNDYALHLLLNSTHQEIPYTSTGVDVWDALIDIHQVQDGTNNFIHLFYTNIVHDDTPGVADSYNREHLWPRQKGVGYDGRDFSDIHAIAPVFWTNKANRVDRYFSNCGIAHPLAECIKPTDTFNGLTEYDSSTFAPATNKGDIARALFYMVIRYDGREANTVDLQLTDCPTGEPGEYGYLSQLLQWHMDDPVDAVEQERNNKACLKQGNRNPFVDIPSLVHHYFGYPQTPLGDGLGYNCPLLTLLHTADFETGWDGWIDGGSDAYRIESADYCKSGFCIRLRDNSGGASTMTRSFGDLSSYDALKIEFSFYARELDPGEDFFLEVTNTIEDSSSWKIAEAWVVTDDFPNNAFTDESVVVDGSVLFPEGGFGQNVALRIRCDASSDTDKVYVDDVTIYGVTIATVTAAPTTTSSVPSSSPTESLSPTSEPTKSPTSSPTSSPTATPTSEPTKSPTSSPTSSPTGTPTSEPTNSPTSSPTTGAPSSSPTTGAPSSSPTTGAPTTSPTSSPLGTPTLEPTKSPTTSPTSSPTVTPTSKPTKSPTTSPTSSPTGAPTSEPTKSPTTSPTSSPTETPTSEPTKSPTTSPTSSPTKTPSSAPVETVLSFTDFESGMGDWNGVGGSDVRRSSQDSNYANSGSYCVRLRDNSGAASSIYQVYDASSYSSLRVEFSYIAVSMERNEDFFLEVSFDGGSTYSPIKVWVSGVNLSNSVRGNEVVDVPDNYGGFTSSTRLRFRCDASNNADRVYLDDIRVIGLS